MFTEAIIVKLFLSFNLLDIISALNLFFSILTTLKNFFVKNSVNSPIPAPISSIFEFSLKSYQLIMFFLSGIKALLISIFSSRDI